MIHVGHRRVSQRWTMGGAARCVGGSPGRQVCRPPLVERPDSRQGLPQAGSLGVVGGCGLLFARLGGRPVGLLGIAKIIPTTKAVSYSSQILKVKFFLWTTTN